MKLFVLLFLHSYISRIRNKKETTTTTATATATTMVMSNKGKGTQCHLTFPNHNTDLKMEQNKTNRQVTIITLVVEDE